VDSDSFWNHFFRLYGHVSTKIFDLEANRAFSETFLFRIFGFGLVQGPVFVYIDVFGRFRHKWEVPRGKTGPETLKDANGAVRRVCGSILRKKRAAQISIWIKRSP